MGSDSDLPTMKVAAEILEAFGVNAEVSIVSAHRTPDRMLEYARNAHKRGIHVIIAGAGGTCSSLILISQSLHRIQTFLSPPAYGSFL